MAWTYDPQEAVNVWPEGDYPATIERTAERDSRAGNPMLVVTFRVYKGTDEMVIDDYIVRPSTVFKLKRIAQALGREADFNAGKFNLDDYCGHNITVGLAIKPADGKYEESNTIKRYAAKTSGEVQRRVAPAKTPAAAPLTDEDIDIPF